MEAKNPADSVSRMRSNIAAGVLETLTFKDLTDTVVDFKALVSEKNVFLIASPDPMARFLISLATAAGVLPDLQSLYNDKAKDIHKMLLAQDSAFVVLCPGKTKEDLQEINEQTNSFFRFVPDADHALAKAIFADTEIPSCACVLRDSRTVGEVLAGLTDIVQWLAMHRIKGEELCYRAYLLSARAFPSLDLEKIDESALEGKGPVAKLDAAQMKQKLDTVIARAQSREQRGLPQIDKLRTAGPLIGPLLQETFRMLDIQSLATAGTVSKSWRELSQLLTQNRIHAAMATAAQALPRNKNGEITAARCLGLVDEPISYGQIGTLPVISSALLWKAGLKLVHMLYSSPAACANIITVSRTASNELLDTLKSDLKLPVCPPISSSSDPFSLMKREHALLSHLLLSTLESEMKAEEQTKTPEEIKTLNQAKQQIYSLSLLLSSHDMFSRTLSPQTMQELPAYRALSQLNFLALALRVSIDLKSGNYDAAQRYANNALELCTLSRSQVEGKATEGEIWGRAFFLVARACTRVFIRHVETAAQDLTSGSEALANHAENPAFVSLSQVYKQANQFVNTAADVFNARRQRLFRVYRPPPVPVVSSGPAEPQAPLVFPDAPDAPPLPQSE